MKHLLLLTLLLAPVLRAQEAQPKTAEEILRIVRLSYALQNHKMSGHLRDDATGRIEPLTLTMENQVMRFLFTNPPKEIVHLDLNTSPATLYQVRAGGSSQVQGNQYAASVRGMAFNYEDLSLRFLYWPRPQLMGEGRVSGQKCWIVRVTNPGKDGPYYVVDIYVHQGSGGAAKMEAYDRNSKVVKKYQVTKVQKVDKATVLKELKIETINPFNGDVKGRTYMIMENPEKK
ncbi:outer membrane lipoprotein-sorting protein [Prosthecobacter sp.]|uniref:outer membrane lipoprotein-sorting protein n=1 Tax=Prosthecobacter sp. TaxID=1965333 RepID=UPI002ABBF2FB|nr:outer membrane lipoprotein-sorting protein [Prosthecobacter sp.]MDZ4401555.1 outer membrane lipoprotein-sorting protein [Prosthecobacter sp.]